MWPVEWPVRLGEPVAPFYLLWLSAVADSLLTDEVHEPLRGIGPLTGALEAAEKTRRARLDAVKRRGECAWTEIQSEIKRRNASGYHRAAALFADLKQLAAELGAADFLRRLAAIRKRHARKGQFIKRLQEL